MTQLNTILITSIGATGAQNVIKALRKQSKYTVRIIGCDATENNPGKHFVDEFHLIPSGKDANYTHAVHTICVEEGVNLFIPIMEAELEAVSANMSLLAAFNPVVSSHNTILICNDKTECNARIRSLGIDCPETFPTKKSIRFPSIRKPKKGTGSTAITVLRTADDTAALPEQDTDFFIQRFVSGTEYTVDCYSSSDNSFIACVPRQRLVTKGGLSTQTRTVDDPELIAICKKILQSIRIKGPCNIQFIKDEQGIYQFIELNPRFGGAYIASIEAGLNAPLFLLNEIHSDPIEYHGYKKNLLMMRYWQEVYENDLV
jgi:carbamoyl-phosphate synthase large subunit